MRHWAEHHRARLEAGLAEGEELRGAQRVVLDQAQLANAHGAAAEAASDPVLLAYSRNPRPIGRAMHRRLRRARDIGFELPGVIFVLGLSDQRLLLWKASAALARPVELTASVPLREVTAMRAMRRFGRERLAVLRGDEQLLVVRSLWGAGLEDLAAAYAAAAGPD